MIKLKTLPFSKWNQFYIGFFHPLTHSSDKYLLNSYYIQSILLVIKIILKNCFKREVENVFLVNRRKPARVLVPTRNVTRQSWRSLGISFP